MSKAKIEMKKVDLERIDLMKDTIFREYDIRGFVGTELIIEEVYALTRAIAYYFVERNPQVKTVAVGMDGRTHSLAIKTAMCQALVDSGLDVVFVGVCPSPALYFALHTLPVDAGMMITASHNSKEYNGIKICLGTSVVWGEEINKIRGLYHQKKFIGDQMGASGQGQKNGGVSQEQSTVQDLTIQKRIVAHEKGVMREYQIIKDYVTWLADHFKHLRGMNMSVVVDCGNGAAGTVLPQLVKVMQWPHVQLLYPEVDGDFPHHEADPTVEKNMQDVKQWLQMAQSHTTAKRQENDRLLGIGLDGDCDRMDAMTQSGKLVPGDQLLALFAQDVINDHAGAGIVCDIKSSSGLIELLHTWGAKVCISPSGHAIIKDQMKKYAAILGGELSCHFFFHDRYFGYDDGIYAMLRLFELLAQSGKSLDELLTIFPNKYSTREFRIPFDDSKKNEIIAEVKAYFVLRADAQIMTIDGIRVTMPYGWGIVRASNTQPVLTIRFESDTSDGLERIKQDFQEVLQPYFDHIILKEIFNT